jgi:hypothetical protein
LFLIAQDTVITAGGVVKESAPGRAFPLVVLFAPELADTLDFLLAAVVDGSGALGDALSGMATPMAPGSIAPDATVDSSPQEDSDSDDEDRDIHFRRHADCAAPGEKEVSKHTEVNLELSFAL